MNKEMRKEFLDMLKEERNSETGWAIIVSMVSMVENDERMEYLAELHRGMHDYGNYMTEKEAKKVVEGFVSWDGSRGQKWSMDTIADELRKVGGVLMKLGLPMADIPKAAYLMALARLDDKDAKMTIREYYGLE
jgi:hypothetical protein